MKTIFFIFLFFVPSVALATPVEGVITWEEYHYLSGFAGLSTAVIMWTAFFKAML